MKYYLESNDLYIEIPTLVFNQIKLQAEGEYPNENGGMLAGRYSTDRHTVYIEKVVVPLFFQHSINKIQPLQMVP